MTVLGAGLSAARFPMTTQLRSLLWHAIDAVPAARDGLAATLGIAGTAKEMIGQDSDAVDSAWRLVERDPASGPPSSAPSPASTRTGSPPPPTTLSPGSSTPGWSST